jgi:hypothetical protein
MSVKLDLTYEAVDSLMISLILEGYELCYWSYRNDQKKFVGKEIPDHWEEEFAKNSQTLDAFYLLLEHYGGCTSDLERIRNKIDYGDKIIQGMSEKLR